MKPHSLKFTGIILKEGHWYISLCPELDVASQGKTIAQAKSMLKEAVALYLETAFESNLSYLRPIPPSENPLLTNPKSVLETFCLDVQLHVVANAA
jgi:predicted RNase H-like HicB family nuclease